MTSPLLSPGQLWLGVVRGSDEEAFQRLLSIMLKPDIDPASFVHGEVIQDPTNPAKVSTTVSVQRAKADISLWPYTDSLAISYKRIKLEDVADYFGNVIRVDLPSTVRDVMRVYFSQHQLHDRSSQVQDGTITDVGVYEVNAIPGMTFIEGAAGFTIKPFQRQLVDVIQQPKVPGFRTPADFTGSPLNKLFDQVSSSNPDLRYPLELELTSFDTPNKISGYALDNTVIVMTASGDGFYKGDVELTYTRHDFGWSTGGSQHYVEGPAVPTTQYMISRVSAITGFPITLDDVVVETYAPIVKGALETLTVFFKPDSYRYAGELTIDYKAV